MFYKNDQLLSDILHCMLLTAFFAVALPLPAIAQDLAHTVNKLVGTELTDIPDLINAVFYIGGAAYSGAGLLKLKQHADNPTQTKLGEGIGRLSVGAGLMALPYISNTVINTFGWNTAAAPYTQFTPVQ